MPTRRFRGILGACGAALGCIVCAVLWMFGNEGDLAQGKSPPPMPELPETAQPKLVLSAPLPALAAPYFAKPVITADHERRTVVSQAMTVHGWHLAQWESNREEGWSEARFLGSQTQPDVIEADPWLETDRRGRFSLVHLDVRLDAQGGAGLVLRRSMDGASTWLKPQSIAKSGDRPVLGVSSEGKYWVIAVSMSERRDDAPQKPLDGNDPELKTKIAAMFRYTSGIFISQNQGRSWKCLPGPLGETHAVPLSVIIDDEGRIASSWIAARGLAVAGVPADSRSVVAVSLDNGVTWTETELVPDLQPDRNHPFNGQRLPVLALGSQGRLYVAYVESLAAGLSFRQSDDWKQWTESVRLSDESTDQVRLPAIAALGPMVHIIWAERHNGRWKLYYRGSRNRGEAWSDRVLLSVPHESSSLIDEYGFDLVSDDDQFCVRDDGAGTVHAVWTVRGNGANNSGGRVWYAAIRWQSD